VLYFDYSGWVLTDEGMPDLRRRGGSGSREGGGQEKGRREQRYERQSFVFHTSLSFLLSLGQESKDNERQEEWEPLKRESEKEEFVQQDGEIVEEGWTRDSGSDWHVREKILAIATSSFVTRACNDLTQS
jgi:hypothetical protein